MTLRNARPASAAAATASAVAAAAVPAADAADAAAAAAVAVVAGGVPAAEIVPTAGVTSDRDLVTGTRDTVESKTVEGG